MTGEVARRYPALTMREVKAMIKEAEQRRATGVLPSIRVTIQVLDEYGDPIGPQVDSIGKMLYDLQETTSAYVFPVVNKIFQDEELLATIAEWWALPLATREERRADYNAAYQGVCITR